MLQSIEAIHLRRVPGTWPLAPDLMPKVDAHWRDLVEANPHLWNGRVLGTLAPGRPGGIAIEDGVLTADAIEGDFATFLAWRDWGFPEIGIRNLFGSALVLTSDDALIYGVMARTTANAGKIYPPGGSLEPADCDDEGRVQVVASIERELREETGLDAAGAVCEGMLAAFDGPRVSIGRMLRFPVSADELVDAIMANLDVQEERELERVIAFRRGDDLNHPRLPSYARRFLEVLIGDATLPAGL